MPRHLGIVSACDTDLSWDELERREGGRFCDHCQEVVVDLRHVTASEARRRYDEAGGELCAWVREDADGLAVFRHEPLPRRGLGAAVFGAALAAACGGEPAEPPAPAEPTLEARADEDTAPEEASATREEETAQPTVGEPTQEVGAGDDTGGGAAAVEATTEHAGTGEASDDATGDPHDAHPGEPHTPAHTARHGTRRGRIRPVERPAKLRRPDIPGR